MSSKTKSYIAAVLASGTLLLFFAARWWSPVNATAFAALLSFTLLSSTLKVRIPGMTGTISPNFAFILVAAVSLPFSQTMVLAVGAALVQCYWASQSRPRMVQVLFSSAALVLSTASAFAAGRLMIHSAEGISLVPAVLLSGTVYMCINTALVSIVVSLAENQDLKEVWQRCYDCVFPYFAFGIIVTGLLSGSLSMTAAWRTTVQVAPAMFLAYLYFLKRSDKQIAVELARD